MEMVFLRKKLRRYFCRWKNISLRVENSPMGWNVEKSLKIERKEVSFLIFLVIFFWKWEFLHPSHYRFFSFFSFSKGNINRDMLFWPFNNKKIRQTASLILSHHSLILPTSNIHSFRIWIDGNGASSGRDFCFKVNFYSRTDEFVLYEYRE